jgi:ubiquinone/menaquinone biosynthesis C-methylase UbiE
VDRLVLEKDSSVLETGTGTGIALPGIARRIGKEGRLHGSDISEGMLKSAQKKMKAKGIRVELLLANASYLPYRSSMFDAILHIGGWNTFAEKRRAMDEMYRVAKPGGRIVICDEGLSPAKEESGMGRRILRHDIGGLYSMKPPKDLVPDNVQDVKVYHVWHDVYWVVEFRKGT